MFDVWSGGSRSKLGEGRKVALEKVHEVTAEGFGIDVSVEPTFLEPITIQAQVPWLQDYGYFSEPSRGGDDSLTHPRTVALRSLH